MLLSENINEKLLKPITVIYKLYNYYCSIYIIINLKLDFRQYFFIKINVRNYWVT